MSECHKRKRDDADDDGKPGREVKQRIDAPIEEKIFPMRHGPYRLDFWNGKALEKPWYYRDNSWSDNLGGWFCEGYRRAADDHRFGPERYYRADGSIYQVRYESGRDHVAMVVEYDEKGGIVSFVDWVGEFQAHGVSLYTYFRGHSIQKYRWGWFGLVCTRTEFYAAHFRPIAKSVQDVGGFAEPVAALVMEYLFLKEIST